MLRIMLQNEFREYADIAVTLLREVAERKQHPANEVYRKAAVGVGQLKDVHIQNARTIEILEAKVLQMQADLAVCQTTRDNYLHQIDALKKENAALLEQRDKEQNDRRMWQRSTLRARTEVRLLQAELDYKAKPAKASRKKS